MRIGLHTPSRSPVARPLNPIGSGPRRPRSAEEARAGPLQHQRKDSYQPTEFPYYFRVLKTEDDYFDHYRHYHAFWKLYGIDLPDEVLPKVYYANALRVVRGLPQTGWEE